MSSLSRWELEDLIEDLTDRLDAEHEKPLDAEAEADELEAKFEVLRNSASEGP